MRKVSISALALSASFTAGSLLVAGCSDSSESAGDPRLGSAESAVAVADVLECESPSPWQVTGAKLEATADHKTQGAAALQLSSTWASLVSEPFSTAGLAIGPYFALDLRILDPQTNAWWDGTVQVRLSIPSAGLTDVLVGTQPLSGRDPDTFQTLAFRLSPQLRDALDQQPGDVSLRVVFSIPEHAESVVFDNMRFDFTPSEEDHEAIFGFESEGEFTASAPIFTASSPVVEGDSSLGVQAPGFTIITTRPFYTGGFTASDELNLDVYIPAPQANPWYFGSVEIRASSPSAGLPDTSLGNMSLSGLTQGAFNRISFAVPADVKRALRAERADAQLKIVLNAPPNNGTYYLDNLSFSAPTIPVERAATHAMSAASLLQQAYAAEQQGGQMQFDLFPDLSLVLQDIQVEDIGAGQTIVGQIAPPHLGTAYLSVSGGALSGVFQPSDVAGSARYYEIKSTGPAEVEVSQLDPDSYPREAEPELYQGRVAQPSVSGALSLATDPEHDVLVVFTPAVVAGMGSAAKVEAHIQTAVTMANKAYAGSGINQRLILAHTQLVDYVESEDFGENLSRLQATNDGHLDEVHAIRDRFGADLVVLMMEGGPKCGKANLAFDSSDADDDSAFAIVDRNCVFNHSFAHELGHIAGAHHDWFVDPTPLPSYAHGFVFIPGQWRTIMSYNTSCEILGTTCKRIGFFSTPQGTNPDDGLPLGLNIANNARRLNETAVTLENFRLRGPRVSLYEGNDGTQDHVCVVPASVDTAVNFTDSSNMRWCDNDEARSIKLFDVPAGRVIRLYDSADGSTQDDWVEIRVKRGITEKLIGTLEGAFEDDDVRVVVHRNDGLDGKVSRVEVASATFGAMVDLHEGNNGQQNLVCSVGVGQSINYHFPSHAECDNDEARSLTLTDVPSGTLIRLFDSSDGSRADDWVEIVAKRDIATKLIGTFEAGFEDDDVLVIYHGVDNLDGKVSRMEVLAGDGPMVDLHEGNNGSQDLVCALPAGQPVSVDFTSGGPCANDEARSITLRDVSAGTVLFLYDSSGGNREDDWVAIEALQDVSFRRVDTFETSFEDAALRMLFFPNNGLDGKVSRLEVRRSTELSGVLSLYEGNNGTQNKVCDLDAISGVVRFPSHSACDNDETRSMVLTQVSAGTLIEVYDDGDCETTDDWTEILVKRAALRTTIDTYEQSFENDDLLVTHHHVSNLDGKVSCIRITAP